MMNELFASFELIVFLLFLYRVVRYFIQGGKGSTDIYILVSFISILLVNLIAFKIFAPEDLFYLFHSFAPSTIVLIVLFNQRVNTILLVLISFAIGLLLLFISNLFLFAGIYYTAIGILLYKSFIVVKQNGKSIHKSPVFFFIALRLFFTFYALALKFTHYNWYDSKYVIYLHYFTLLIFATTSILIHAKFRRFFIN